MADEQEAWRISAEASDVGWKLVELYCKAGKHRQALEVGTLLQPCINQPAGMLLCEKYSKLHALGDNIGFHLAGTFMRVLWDVDDCQDQSGPTVPKETEVDFLHPLSFPNPPLLPRWGTYEARIQNKA